MALKLKLPLFLFVLSITLGTIFLYPRDARFVALSKQSGEVVELVDGIVFLPITISDVTNPVFQLPPYDYLRERFIQNAAGKGVIILAPVKPTAYPQYPQSPSRGLWLQYILLPVCLMSGILFLGISASTPVVKKERMEK